VIPESWLAERCGAVEVSGVRKIFELGKSLANPVNLSIGQPHFDVPEPVKTAAKAAIDAGHNGYTVTQGIPELLAAFRADIRARFPGQERDFRLDLNKLADAITPRTKAVLLSTPSNPTGAVIDADTQKELADLCRARGVLLVSDEIYRAFQYDAPHVSPARYDPNVLVVEGFGKTYGMTGWRLGWAHGPKRLIQEMAKFQQFTFVCAPSVVQHAGVAALNYDVSGIVADYRRKRDLLVAGLKDDYEFAVPGGAFYLFPKVPWSTGTEFVTEAIAHNLLIIPGGVFSGRDTHVRISYAAPDEALHRGIEILRKLARAHGAV
jgi:aspartate aminotransferase/aminotransferase